MDKLTGFFKLLSDETRLRILVLLLKQDYCVCEMCGIMEESQPKVSKHLAKLRDMGLVKDKRREQFIYYALTLENPLYREIIEGIDRNLNYYPLLKQDAERSKNSKVYLEACITKGQKNLENDFEVK